MINLIQGIVYLIAIALFFVFILIKSKKIISFAKELPVWFWAISVTMLSYKIFYLPHIISYKSDFGAWILGMAKEPGLFAVLENVRSPVYFFLIKIFSIIFNGVSFNLIVNWHIILFFISSILLYLLCKKLFKSEVIAGIATILFIFNPILLITSINENNANLAIFFSLISLLFVVLYAEDNNDNIWLYASVCAAILAAGTKPEYIAYSMVYCVFLYFILKKQAVFTILMYLVLVTPRLIVSVIDYISSATLDTALHGETVESSSHVFSLMFIHFRQFVEYLWPNFLVLLNPQNLTGILFVFSLITIFRLVKDKKIKMNYFFVFFFCFVFVYYVLFHVDGFYKDEFKYTPILLLPLIFLAASGMGILYNRNNFFRYFTIFLLAVMSVYGLYFTHPNVVLSSKSGRYSHRAVLESAEYREYINWRNNEKLIDLEAIFISDNHITMHNSALRIKEANTFSVFKQEEFFDQLSKITPGTKVYFSKGYIGQNVDGPVNGNNKLKTNDLEEMAGDKLRFIREIFNYSEGETDVYLKEYIKR